MHFILFSVLINTVYGCLDNLGLFFSHVSASRFLYQQVSKFLCMKQSYEVYDCQQIPIDLWLYYHLLTSSADMLAQTLSFFLFFFNYTLYLTFAILLLLLLFLPSSLMINSSLMILLIVYFCGQNWFDDIIL